METDTTKAATKRFFIQPLELVLSLILLAIVGVTFIQVLFRYLFHLSLAWSEELARYLFLWLGALASAYAFKTKSHFAIRFLVDRLGERFQGWVDTVVVFIVSGFLILFVWKSLEFSISMSRQIAPSTKISMAVPYSSAWVGGAMMLYYVLRNWWLDRQTKKKRKSNPGRKWDSLS
jgi:TRAP-type C4-dicarboxylate transport system permease small subunit